MYQIQLQEKGSNDWEPLASGDSEHDAYHNAVEVLKEQLDERDVFCRVFSIKDGYHIYTDRGAFAGADDDGFFASTNAKDAVIHLADRAYGVRCVNVGIEKRAKESIAFRLRRIAHMFEVGDESHALSHAEDLRGDFGMLPAFNPDEWSERDGVGSLIRTIEELFDFCVAIRVAAEKAKAEEADNE